MRIEYCARSQKTLQAVEPLLNSGRLLALQFQWNLKIVLQNILILHFSLISILGYMLFFECYVTTNSTVTLCWIKICMLLQPKFVRLWCWNSRGDQLHVCAYQSQHWRSWAYWTDVKTVCFYVFCFNQSWREHHKSSGPCLLWVGPW